MYIEGLKKALSNNRKYIEEELQSLLNDKKYDEIFDMFEKYFKYKNSLDNKKMDYHYRSSLLKSNKGYICLEVTLKLRKGNSELILEVIRDRKKRRA